MNKLQPIYLFKFCFSLFIRKLFLNIFVKHVMKLKKLLYLMVDFNDIVLFIVMNMTV